MATAADLPNAPEDTDSESTTGLQTTDDNASIETLSSTEVEILSGPTRPTKNPQFMRHDGGANDHGDNQATTSIAANVPNRPETTVGEAHAARPAGRPSKIPVPISRRQPGTAQSTDQVTGGRSPGSRLRRPAMITSTKPLTIPVQFELPGDAISRQNIARREERLQRLAAEQMPTRVAPRPTPLGIYLKPAVRVRETNASWARADLINYGYVNEPYLRHSRDLEYRSNIGTTAERRRQAELWRKREIADIFRQRARSAPGARSCLSERLTGRSSPTGRKAGRVRFAEGPMPPACGRESGLVLGRR